MNIWLINLNDLSVLNHGPTLREEERSMNGLGNASDYYDRREPEQENAAMTQDGTKGLIQRPLQPPPLRSVVWSGKREPNLELGRRTPIEVEGPSELVGQYFDELQAQS
jgi:hypothetical protein